jgi:hypothetical protein
MKRLLLIAVFVMACGLSHADINLEKLPPLKQGVAFSVGDSEINYLATFDVAKFKGFALEAGYAGRAQNTQDKAVVVLSYELFNAKASGVTLPILDLIDLRPGIYYGLGRIEAPADGGVDFEQDYGISATVLNIKW